MHIAIVDMLGTPYDGSTLSKRGLGGSESAVISIARELTKIGVQVTVFNDCDSADAEPGVYDGVHYQTRESAAFSSICYDVVISSRSVTGVDVVVANKKILWMHDTFAWGDQILESEVVQGKLDEVWTLSDFHTSYVTTCNHGHKRMFEVLKRKIWQTRNGANIHGIPDLANKEDRVFVWNAATNKGLTTLLEDVWPRVRQYIPDAALVVIGGYYKMATEDVQQIEWKRLFDAHQHENGVHFTGIIPQFDIQHWLKMATAMIYPQSLPETYGISALESLVYGTPIITGRFGALEEIAIEEACYLMDYPVDSNSLYTFDKEAHVEAFIEQVLKCFNDQYVWKQKCNAALKVREVCGWDKVALQWKQHLYKITDRYLPIDEYRKVTEINQRVKEIFKTRFSNPEDQVVSYRFEPSIRVVVPFRNAEQWITKCVESIASQDYENYTVDLIDDASTDNTFKVYNDFIGNYPNIGYKFEYQWNDESHGALSNQCELSDGYHSEDIVVLIDGDDWLVNDPNIFRKIARIYEDEKVMMTYGSCHSVVDNIPLIAQEYPDEVKQNKTYRDHKFAWNIPYTHLRTFKTELYNRIDRDSLLDSNGDYYRAGGDGALLYALLEAAEPDAIRAVRDVWYMYNDANPANDYKVNSEEQTRNAEAIVKKKDKSLHMKRILIAIPTAQNIHPETFKSIYDLEVPDGYEVDFQYFYGYCIDQVRNLIASWVVDGYDYLFAVDYDMSFPTDTLKKLLETDQDIVSGLYRQRKPELIYEIYRGTQQLGHFNVPHDDINRKELEVSGCGFGCVLVKKHVFEAVGYPWFTYHHALEMKDTISEDVDFCNKAIDKGFTIVCRTDVRCSHHGQATYELPPLRSFDPANQ